MRLKDLFAQKRSSLSFEVFPPKTADGYESVSEAVKAIVALSPDYMSVTYGAGGTNAGMATSIATEIQREFGVTSLAHFSCISSTQESVREHLESLKANGIENILALRGDLPDGFGNIKNACGCCEYLDAVMKASFREAAKPFLFFRHR